MTQIRQAVLALAIALALLVPFAGVASADPGDPGGTTFSSSSSKTTATSNRRGNDWGHRDSSTTSTTSVDPGDPGGTTN